MKRAKRIYILLGVLAVVCLAAVGVIHYQEETERIANTDEIVLEIDPDTVESLSWSYEDTSLSFTKEESWVCDEDAAFPVDQEKVADLLEQFRAFGASFIIEEVTDYGQYGLDDPVCTINLSTADTDYEVLLGDYSAMDSQRYVSVGDGNVYLVQTDPMESFEITLPDMIQDDEIPDFDTVQSFTVTGVDDYTATYQEENTSTACEEDVYFVQEEGLALDTSRVESYLSALSGLDKGEYLTYNAAQEDLESTGLDDPQMTVSVVYLPETEDEDEETQAQTFTFSVSQDPDQRDSEEELEAEEITAYLRVGESPILYKLSGEDYQTLMAAARDDLRHQELFAASFDQVTALEVTLEDTTYQLAAQGEDEDRVLVYNEEELDPADLQTALEALTASQFTQESPDGKEEISLTLTLDNENVTQMTLTFYRYDGQYCLAVLDGSPLCLVDRSAVVDLMEAVNALVL